VNSKASVLLFAGVVLGLASPLSAEMQVRVVYDNNATMDVGNPSAQNDAIALPQGVLPFSRISRMDFNFGSNVTPQKCEALLREGQFEQLNQLLTVSLKQASPFQQVPGNLDSYLIWQMKAQFWTGQYAGVIETANLLKQRNPAQSGPAGMYIALALIEQNRADDARLVFAAADNAEAGSSPEALFVKARLAMEKREYREALQHLARMVVFYGRDSEWMPAATLYEGLVYKRTGYLETAGNVAKEMNDLYSGGYWSRRAGELK
jgi:tetratricopeptide (TPR) repeat protein